MQAPSPQKYDQSIPVCTPEEVSSSALRGALLNALHRERLRSPIPIAALRLSAGPLLILVDADTLSEAHLIKILQAIVSVEPNCQCVVSANRALPQCQRWADHQSVMIEVYHVPQGADEADLALMRRGVTLLSQERHSAALILTQDRDLIELALCWRRAKRPAFMVPLREDFTAKALLKRSQKREVSALSLRDLTLDVNVTPSDATLGV